MSNTLPKTALQLRTLISADGQLTMALHDEPMPTLGAKEVLIRVEAAPINPSDIGLLFGAADMAKMQAGGSASHPSVSAPVPERAMAMMAGRLGQDLPAGNEGAGVVVAAGDSPEAQALMGAHVAGLGGAMYAQYRALPAAQCLRLPEGATSAQGASCFVNPLTALGMVQTMTLEGHKALVHTAAASNLGQMLNRICIKDGVPLVNIVRSPEQVALLQGQGAKYVCNMSAPDFKEQLVKALVETGATIAFDATGGGSLGGQILAAMEVALLSVAKEYSRYGTSTHKQVYLYGGLDLSPTTFSRSFGMAWSMGGWLLFPFLQRLGAERTAALKQRVADELHTTFASQYAGELSLAQMCAPESIKHYNQRATGAKYLVTPQA